MNLFFENEEDFSKNIESLLFLQIRCIWNVFQILKFSEYKKIKLIWCIFKVFQ